MLICHTSAFSSLFHLQQLSLPPNIHGDTYTLTDTSTHASPPTSPHNLMIFRTCAALQRQHVHLRCWRAGVGHEAHELSRPLPHVRPQVTLLFLPTSVTYSYLLFLLLLSLSLYLFLCLPSLIPLIPLSFLSIPLFTFIFFLLPLLFLFSFSPYSPSTSNSYLSFICCLPPPLHSLSVINILSDIPFLFFSVRTCYVLRIRSYRELPIRVADFGVLHRNELSGQFLLEALLCGQVVPISLLFIYSFLSHPIPSCKILKRSAIWTTLDFLLTSFPSPYPHTPTHPHKHICILVIHEFSFVLALIIGPIKVLWLAWLG